jgi:EpsD family peptidyl-prolyl cis-trans isomerase
MRLRSERAGIVLGLALVLGSACSKGDKQAPGKPGALAPGKQEVLARVAGKPIRQQDVDDARSILPEYRQKEFEGARGTLRLLNSLVDRELVLKAAAEQGLERDPEIARQLDNLRTSVLIQAYQKKLVESQPKPTDPQIREYYDQHTQEFVIPARVNASWIKTKTRADAEKARRRIVERGDNFATVAREVSTDAATNKDGGLLGYFNPTGYIRSVGADTAFARQAFALEAGDVGPVFPYQDAWAFIKVHEKTTERTEPFERAQERIKSRLTPSYSDSLMQRNLASLRDKYKVQVLYDIDKQLEGKSAEELMRLATETQDPTDKIEYYRALLRKYPTYERADEAQFMIGFVFSEDLHDFEKAKPEYQKVLDNYPASSLRESVQYMLQNMGHGALPNFEEPSTPAPVGGH